LLNAKLVPSCGALWGIYTEPTGSEGWAQPVTSLEQSTGRTFDIVKRYHDWSNAGGNGQFPDTFEQALGANGQRLLDFSWTSNIYSTGGHVMWADIAAGVYDSSVILPEAARLKAWAQPVFMDFDHEMEGQDRLKDGSPAEYIAAYQHIHDVFDSQGVTNVIWVWTSTGWLANVDRIAATYPGDAYVDWIGYDPYNFYTCNGSAWETPTQIVEPFYNWLMSNGHGNKPFMLGEYGSVATSTATGAWYGGVVPALKGLPNIKAVMEWNSETSTACDFRVTTQPTILAGFTQAGLDPYVNQR
jgi:Glycosyl hydrolase family 26